MAYVDKTLKKKIGGKYLKLEEGDKVKGIYKGWVERDSEKFGMKTYFRISVEGEVRELGTSSQSAVKAFTYIKPGSTVIIKREGTGNQTQYIIKAVGTVDDDEEDDDEDDEIEEKPKKKKVVRKEDEDDDEDDDEDEEDEEDDDDDDDDDEEDEEEEEEEPAPKKKKSKKKKKK